LISPAECVVAVVGASPDVPLPSAPEGCQFRFITSREQLVRDAADADVVFAWQPRLDWIQACWGWSSRLRWIAAACSSISSSATSPDARFSTSSTSASASFPPHADPARTIP
jgi:hypothetical protein